MVLVAGLSESAVTCSTTPLLNLTSIQTLLGHQWTGFVT